MFNPDVSLGPDRDHPVQTTADPDRDHPVQTAPPDPDRASLGPDYPRSRS